MWWPHLGQRYYQKIRVSLIVLFLHISLKETLYHPFLKLDPKWRIWHWQCVVMFWEAALTTFRHSIEAWIWLHFCNRAFCFNYSTKSSYEAISLKFCVVNSLVVIHHHSAKWYLHLGGKPSYSVSKRIALFAYIHWVNDEKNAFMAGICDSPGLFFTTIW